MKTKSETWNARFCMSAFTGALASLSVIVTKTGPAGMVSNSGVKGFGGVAADSSDFGPSSFLARSATEPSAPGPAEESVAEEGGFSFFSSGLRPSATWVVLPSKVVSLTVR